jgi:hypothetical protein
LFQVVRIWKWRSRFCFDRLVGVAQANLARAVIAGLYDVVIRFWCPQLQLWEAIEQLDSGYVCT